jgi:phosphoribosyl 1,2-cyclic phosphate phosphodiesterase
MDPFMIGDIRIIPIQVWHLKMPVLGFRFGNFTYITDANRIEESEKQKIRGSGIVVLNALRVQKHISHFNLEEAITMAGDLGVSAAYFTHISHQLGKHADVMAELPEGIELAYDGLKLKA